MSLVKLIKHQLTSIISFFLFLRNLANWTHLESFVNQCLDKMYSSSLVVRTPLFLRMYNMYSYCVFSLNGILIKKGRDLWSVLWLLLRNFFSQQRSRNYDLLSLLSSNIGIWGCRRKCMIWVSWCLMFKVRTKGK